MWWKTLLIILIVIIGYILYINITGKKRRDKIIKQIISDSFFLHKNETVNLAPELDLEAVKKFAEENNGYIEKNYVTVDTSTNGEEIHTSFFCIANSDNIGVTSINKEEYEKRVELQGNV